MSRVPQRSPQKQQARTPISTPRSRVGSTLNSGAAPSPRPRTKSTPKAPAGIIHRRSPDQIDSPSVKTNLNIREAIALKRAEAKKSAFKNAESGLDSLESLQNSLPVAGNQATDDDVVDLGRWSVKETIERARSTGSINLSSRSLPCLPSALFEIHLGITPDRLDSVPSEPPIGSSSSSTTHLESRTKRQGPSWFEAQDLLTLKAWSNDIIEIQPEIHLFGSLKIVDLHQNKIRSLPDTFANLVALTSLDLSYNQIKVLPTNIFALPALTYLNVSHNALKALPFNSPFSDPSFHSQQSHFEDSFFAPIITRASTPLPSLLTLNVSYNRISASTIDHELPTNLSKLDVSGNPLVTGHSTCQSFLRAMAKLKKLKEIRLENTGIGTDEFVPDLLSGLSDGSPFSALELLDLRGTEVTVDMAIASLSGLSRALSFDATREKPAENIVLVNIDTKFMKKDDPGKRSRTRPPEVENCTPLSAISKYNDGKTVKADAPVTESPSTAQKAPEQAPSEKREIVKEAWEIEAEQGLLTEGGRRRARIMAAAAAGVKDHSPSTDSPSHSETNCAPLFTLSSPQYYSAATQTLTLPPSAPPSKTSRHSRAFSLAISSSSNSLSTTRTIDITVPTPTVPLAVITVQPFALKLRTLILANRQMDRSFSLPFSANGIDGPWLPNLEELNLEGCGFADSVNVSRQQAASGSPERATSRSSELLLPLLTRLFPSLRTLDLSYNFLTSASLTTDILTPLILSSSGDEDRFPRKGLRHLRLRGNKIVDLDGLRGVAELFRGNRDVPAWKLDELDLRDNEITKLPPELGLMPLDIFLVDGNIFRVPQRRIWEREGTKGLLSWLRGRIE